MWRLTDWPKVQEEIKEPRITKSKKAGAGEQQPEVPKCHSPAAWLGQEVPIPTQGNSRFVVAGKSDSFNKATICNSTLSSEGGLTPQSQVGEHQLGHRRSHTWAQEKGPVFSPAHLFPQEREKNYLPVELSSQLKPVFCNVSVSHYEFWSFSYTFSWLNRSPRQFACYKY